GCFAAQRVHALLGARTANLLLGEAEFRRLEAEVHLATDDGSCGFPGTVSGLLQRLLEQGTAFDQVYACGPRAMMAATWQVCRAASLPCVVSMEAEMACGFGVCMGCACRARPAHPLAAEPAYQLVCVNGPVFDAAELVWD
ncbi:MAG: dihydroorotate dehydrogenase electron transfer subunit, partial [Armatimonadota bacterium]|nr:dihydroorotate dehydrogenase electron transfer subunit [Armatimonadota bacterium]